MTGGLHVTRRRSGAGRPAVAEARRVRRPLPEPACARPTYHRHWTGVRLRKSLFSAFSRPTGFPYPGTKRLPGRPTGADNLSQLGFNRILGLTQNDIASFVGWSPQPSAVGPVPHQPGFLIVL